MSDFNNRDRMLGCVYRAISEALVCPYGTAGPDYQSDGAHRGSSFLTIEDQGYKYEIQTVVYVTKDK